MEAHLWSRLVGSQDRATVTTFQNVAPALNLLYQATDGPSLRFLTMLASKQSTRLHLMARSFEQTPSLVALRPDQVVAAAWYAKVFDEAELLDIQVLESTRHQGLGRHLLRSSLRALATEGVNTCHLEVRRSNTAALALYHELGFRQVGERANYYQFQETREDAILLSLSPLL